MLSVGIAVRSYDRKGLCDKPRGGGYIALPLTDPSGQVIGIKYRAVTGEVSEDARRFDATSSALSGAMFGFDRLPLDAHTVIAVEGELDQLSLAAARECDPSLPPAVAWHGKELSGERLALLSSRAKHVVLMLDADEGGFDGILRGGRKLARAGVAISVVRMPADVDANELLRAGDAPGLARAVHNLPRVSLFEEHARVFTRFGPAHVNIACTDPYFVASELSETAEALACIELQADAVERGAKLVNLDPGFFAKYVASARERDLARAEATGTSPRVADYDVAQLLESVVDVEGEEHEVLAVGDAGGL
jgi:DNA primase